MNLDFLEIFGVIADALDLLSSNSSSSQLNYDEKSKIKKKRKYFTETVSAVFLLISAILLFLVFKDPLPAKNYVQTLIVASLMGLTLSFLVFYILYVLEKYYFKSVFQWLLFSSSVILLFVSAVFCIYFKSGIFI